MSERVWNAVAHGSGLLTVLAAAVLFLAAPFLIEDCWLAGTAPGFVEAMFTVEEIEHFVPGPRDDSDETYHLEGSVGGRREEYHPPTRAGHHAGQQIRVLYNPGVRFRDLRVLTWEPDFVRVQRIRAARRVLLATVPGLAFAAACAIAMQARHRAGGPAPNWTWIRIAALIAGLAGAGAVLMRVLVSSLVLFD